MHSIRGAVLILGVLVSSIAVVELRHNSRILFAELQTLQTERDELNIEWGKLLLEEGAWSQHRRIEQMARQRLDMSTPESAGIRVVRVAPDPAP